MSFSGGDLEDLFTAPAKAPFKARNPRQFLDQTTKGSLGRQLLVDPQIEAQKLQEQNLQKQDQAQRTALAEAGSQRRASDVAKKKANQKTPNITALLSSAIASGAGGVNSTLLSGLGGGLGGKPTTLGGR